MATSLHITEVAMAATDVISVAKKQDFIDIKHPN